MYRHREITGKKRPPKSSTVYISSKRNGKEIPY
jgi:hypothetical protein